jgi:cytoskeletal protein CcmA (bactofilin family)
MFFNRHNAINNTMNYLAKGTEVHGSIKTEGSLRVDGSIYGNVDVQGDLEIATTGKIEGSEVRANNIVSQGAIKAQIQAVGKVTLTATARVEGDVVASAIDIASGAGFVGHLVTKDNKILPGTVSQPQLAGRSKQTLETKNRNQIFPIGKNS